MINRISGSACEVHVDPVRRVVCKRVYYTNQGVENGHDKLWYEIKYLQRMNLENDFFPKVLDWYYRDDYLNLELEYLYCGESLADVVMDETVSAEYIEKSLNFILDRLFEEFYKKQNVMPNPNYWQECYLDRTKRRANVSLQLIGQRFPQWKTLKGCIENGIEINGIYYAGIDKYISYLQHDEELLERLKINGTFCSHHDLIPENILINRGSERVSAFKMIDPRGDEETGQDNRHFLYDMGKMLFGLDCYGLFRNGYHAEKFDHFRFSKLSDHKFSLSFNRKSVAVSHLIAGQEMLRKKIIELCESHFGDKGNIAIQLLFSFACMYIPDVPCRIIDEQNEDLALAFYARGCMIMHKLFLQVYREDMFSSDRDGCQFEMWPMEDENG